MPQTRNLRISWLTLAFAGALVACQSAPMPVEPAPAAVFSLNNNRNLDLGGQTGISVPVRVHLSDEGAVDFGLKTINQPTLLHSPANIRSSRVRLYACASLVNAGSTDPSATCGAPVATLNTDHASGLSATWTFNLTNLKNSKFYTASVEFFSGAGQGGTAMVSSATQSWPVFDVTTREAIVTDANGQITIDSDNSSVPYAAGRLDYAVTLKNTTGGSVTGNTVNFTNGTAFTGTETITTP